MKLTQTDFDALPRPKDVTAGLGVQYAKEIDGKPYVLTYVDSYEEKNGTTSWKVSQEEVEIIDDKKEDVTGGARIVKQIAAYLNNNGLTAEDFLNEIQSKIKPKIEKL